MYKLYYGTIVHTPTISWVEIHAYTLIAVDSQGTIQFIETNHQSKYPVTYFAAKFNVKARDVEFHDFLKNPLQFMFPGFVDTHIHASQYPNVGAGLGVPLLDWLKEYTFPLEHAFTMDLKYNMARDVYNKVIQRTLQNGTTCASYFTTVDVKTTELFTDLLIKHGQRAFVGKVCMDHNDPYPSYCESTEQSVETLKHIIDYIEEKSKQLSRGRDGQKERPGRGNNGSRWGRWGRSRKESITTIEESNSSNSSNSLNSNDDSNITDDKKHVIVKPIITPRFAPSCSKDLLESLGALSEDQNLPIQTHIAENLKEIELMKELFPDFNDYASVYDHYKLLTERTVLAHAVHLTDKECDIIKEKKCLISHCPTSNTFISLGEAPVKKYLRHGINVSLGTDVSAGFDVLILQVMKNLILVLHHLAMEKGDAAKLSISEVLYMATQGGAKAVGLGSKIGSFEVGKQWDTQLIRLDSNDSYIDVFEWQVPGKGEWRKMEDLLGKWVFNGDDRNCRKVWVNGILVVEKADHWVMV